MKNQKQVAKCKACGNEFDPKIHRIWHCEKCFKIGLERVIATPPDTIVKETAKNVL